jgi:transposase
VHDVVVVQFPWARHDSGFTRAFEETVAWMATHTSKSALGELMRVAWRTVGRIIERVVGEFDLFDPLDGLRRIGIDEISHRKGQRYITVVVDHDSGRLVWAAPGRDGATVRAFFDALGPERTAAIEVVTADAASWIRSAVQERCPQATLCMDPFHVVAWATKALDQVRRDVWNEARDQGQHAIAKAIKGTRYALWKNPEDLTARQQAKLSGIQKTNRPLYRAYLLKEQLRQVFRLPETEAIELLERWIAWARRCRIEPFVKLAKTIGRHRERIAASLRTRLSNGLVESMNTKIRLIIRRAFGFHSPQPLIALAMLDLGGLCPPLPGRGRLA